MKPMKPDIQYERVTTQDMVTAMISKIEYDPEHKFTFQGQTKTAPAVRLQFQVDGCQYHHYSRWMTFSYGEKTNLYQKYLTALVDNAQPDMDFDLDQLIGMRVRMLWQEKNNFQWPETIRPIDAKLAHVVAPPSMPSENPDGVTSDEELPF